MMKILIYLSSYSNSKAAVMFGGLIARATGAAVTLLTVIGKEQDAQISHDAIYKASWWLADIHTNSSIRRGSEAEGVWEEVSSDSYDLVILKKQLALQLRNLLPPHIGRAAVQQGPVSVLVIKRIQPFLERIIICTSGEVNVDPAVEMGAYLARATSARVTLLHISKELPSSISRWIISKIIFQVYPRLIVRLRAIFAKRQPFWLMLRLMQD